jgi:biopolymer transport protein ExbD
MEYEDFVILSQNQTMTNIEDNSLKGATKRWNVRIDMTPMVDLGFLLITFFIFTSSLTESKAMRLYMPKDGPGMKVSDKNVLTILVAADHSLLVYEGAWNPAGVSNTSTSKLGKLILEKKSRIVAEDPRHKLFVVIKPLETAKFRNIVNVLDEMAIYEVPSYAITEPTKEESEYTIPDR